MSGQGKCCEVCGKSGKDASKCAFEKACSCWYGVPCVNGEPMRKDGRLEDCNICDGTPAKPSRHPVGCLCEDCNWYGEVPHD